MEIREASVVHIPAIIKLAHAIWPVTYKDIISPRQLAYMLELIYSVDSLQKQMDDGHRFFLLFDNTINSREPVGYASFSKIEEYTSHYRLQKLYVLSDQQGKGRGKFLLEHIIAVVKSEGGQILDLTVNRKNPAQNFYHKMGFTIAREEDKDIGDGFFMNDFVMERMV